MKNKILLCGIITIIMALIIVLGYTNARYYSAASMTGDLDYVKSIGKISVYQPVWIEGYEGPDDGSGYFQVPYVPAEFPGIYYKVTNKIGNEINEEEVMYYIRIVAEDGSDNIPIGIYNVHELVVPEDGSSPYDNPANIYDKEEGVGYGPFTLSAGSEETQYYSLKVRWTSTDDIYVKGVQHIKVQIVKKRSDGTLKVIDEAPLNMLYTGPKTRVTFAYYLYGTKMKVQTQQIVDMEDNLTIDFKNKDQLNDLGITLPDGYEFHDIRGNLPGYGGNATALKIPEGYHLEGYWIEVYVTSRTKVAVQLNYYDYTSRKEDEFGNITYDEISEESRQNIVVNRGTLIDFANEAQRKELGINLPVGYTFQGLNGELITNKYNATSVTIPSSTGHILHIIEVHMNPSGPATVNISYYDSAIEPSKLLSKQSSLSILVGNIINFKNLNSLKELGITLPSGYEFKTSYCTELDNTEAGHDTFTIPYTGVNQTYNINVVLNKIVNIIKVPVEFGNSNDEVLKETTVDIKGDGTYDFTTDICRTLCPELADKTSFTIYIRNKWGSNFEVGNTLENGMVTIDYNKTYVLSWGEFKLTDEGTYLYIKAWG